MRRVIALALALTAFGGAQVAIAGWNDADSASASYSSAVLAPPTAPGTTAGTCVLVLGDAINITWTATSSTWADGYEVARSLVSGGPFLVVGTVSGRNSTSFTNASLPYSTTYYYVVRASKGAWRSADTSQVSRTTKNALCI